MDRACLQCSTSFQVTDEDRQFYEKISPVVSGKKYLIPEPTLCPDCRRQRRFSFRNERSFHHRECDLCHKKIIACYPSESPYKVYCIDCWWSDHWDPLDHGQEIDFNRPFFEQFQELMLKVPHLALHQDGTSENCEYINYGFGNKSCYLTLGVQCEEVYYSNPILKSRNCVDCTRCVECELCYECVDCTKSYQLFFSQDCTNCQESWFLKDCIGSKNCFASAGLRNAQHVFLNEQLTKEEYEKRLAELRLTPEIIRQCLKKRDEKDQLVPKKAFHGVGNENVTGDYLDYCKNVHESYDCLVGVENSKYCDVCALNSRELFDTCYTGEGAELCYEANGIAAGYNLQFLYYSRSLRDSMYSQYCMEGKELFGCYGLRKKEFCILNKKYDEETYLQLKGRLIEHLQQTKEWGEFFPMELSAFGYNETVAFEYFPLAKDEVIQKGLKWTDSKETSSSPNDNTIICEISERPFRLIKQELDFYQRFALPHPTEHPDVRHLRRLNARNPRKLWTRSCEKCSNEIQTSYAPDRPEKVYCEECYLNTVY